MRARGSILVVIGCAIATVMLGVYGAGMLYAGWLMPMPFALFFDGLAALAGIGAIAVWFDAFRRPEQLPRVRVRR